MFTLHYYKIRTVRGFSLIEVLLSVASFGLIVTIMVGSFIYGEQSTMIAGARGRAALIAEEGLEVVRNMRDADFAGLSAGAHGLAVSGNTWSFSGGSDATNIFTRQINVSDTDANTKQVTSTVTWTQNAQRNGSIALTSELTNWQKLVNPAPARGGVLVYGDGLTAVDTIKYRVLDTAGAWGAVGDAADVDAASTNKYLRAAKVYSSSTRNEKVLISRHYNGSAQFIYAQVYNGSVWGNVVQLSTWSATTYLDVQNFDGTYLANGDFMAVYSDNTTTPKFRIWNGSSWSGASISTQVVGGIPTSIVAKARSVTNEVMVATFDQASDTNSEYFNGGAYAAGSWTLHTEHATAAPAATKRLVDFDWSPNSPTKGALVYASGNNDKTINIKIWTANDSGSGSWGSSVDSPTQTSNLGALSVAGRKGSDTFIACDKDAGTTPKVICYSSDITPAWTTPSNNTLAAATTTGIQRSFHIDFESFLGESGLGVYSDGTTMAKLKRYDPAGASWDAAATNIGSAMNGVLESTALVPRIDTDDIMILLADTTQRLYTAIWDGTNNATYSSPAGKAFTTQGIRGSADVDFWYGFAWDQF